MQEQTTEEQEEQNDRQFAVDCALSAINGYPNPVYTIPVLLNQAAPVAIDLGNGPIECSGFGSIMGEKISYRPQNRRADCTAVVGGINISDIKSIELI
jgi:hypothetical protein